MGLQSQLNDISSESLPILVVVTIAHCICYLRSLLSTLVQSVSVGVGLSRFGPDDLNDAVLGSGLSGLVVLAEQLNLNRDLSCRYEYEAGSVDNCVVCLNRLSVGDQVRKLACRHVFHKDCLDGWLDHLNFSCPVCRSRSSFVCEERVAFTDKRMTTDILTSFALR